MNEFGRKVGLSQGLVSRLRSDNVPYPQAETIGAVAKGLRVRFEWLMWGEGEMDAPARKANLDAVVSALNFDNRWSTSTIRLAEALAEDYSPRLWPEILDRLEESGVWIAALANSSSRR